MMKFKSIKSIVSASILTICISLITSQNVLAAPQTIKTYTVKRGDCLCSIAQKCGESLNNLRKTNNKYSDDIHPGQVLRISVSPTITVHQTTNGAISYTASELDLLARLITAEAQGEPYNGQVAVGAVVVNRVKSNLFPNSIGAVINQTVSGCYQFTPVLNGNINRPAKATAIKAAYAALSGIDPTNKSLFFYDDLATDAWIKSQPVSMKIDKLIFAY